MDLVDFNKSCGANPSGTGLEILFAKISDFETIAVPTDTPSAHADLVTISANHVFKTGKGFAKLKITDETGEVQSNAVGEKDGRSFEHMVNGFVPNNDKTNAGLLSKMASCDWLFLVPEMGENNQVVYRQIGSRFRGAFNAEANNYTTGVASADRRGTSFTFKATGQPTHAPYYEGEITLLPE